ncbi:MAG: hypothetical protein L0Z50_20965 [Verrucomicrobiales bacterium]|nr:hypothetical protein [Verrucomicrobiales bacterium]
MTNAFVTEGYVYGTPTEKSDIDLVICISKEDFALLESLADGDSKGYGCHVGSLRFGKLNLVCIDECEMEPWKAATDELIARKPVTREEAVKLIEDKIKSKRKSKSAA